MSANSLCRAFRWGYPGLHRPGQLYHIPAVWPWVGDSPCIVQVVVQEHQAGEQGGCNSSSTYAHSEERTPSLKDTKLLCALVAAWDLSVLTHEMGGIIVCFPGMS